MEAEGDHAEAIALFCSVTGGSTLEAEHYLDAHDWDVNRSIEFYLEQPPSAPAPPPRPSSQQGHSHGPAGLLASHALAGSFAFRDHEEAPDLDNLVDEDEEGGGVLVSRRQPQPPAWASSGLGNSNMSYDLTGEVDGDEDEDLRRALAASRGDVEGTSGDEPGLTTAQAAGGGRGVDMDDDEDLGGTEDSGLSAMAAQRARSQAAAQRARQQREEAINMTSGRRPIESLDEMPSMFGRAAGVTTSSSRAPISTRPVARGMPSAAAAAAVAAYAASTSEAVAAAVQGVLGGGGAAGFGAASGGYEPDPDEMELPEGFSQHDLEEARMMEAAMLGIPYEPRLPTFQGRGGGGGGGINDLPGPNDHSIDPLVHEGRFLRREQDDAYEQSLRADRVKAEASQRAVREAAEAARAAEDAAAASAAAARKAESDAFAAAAAAKKRTEQLLAESLARLPAEPASSEPGSLNIMVRLPDGSRQARRFRRTDPLQAVFDHIDVQQLQLQQKQQLQQEGVSSSGGGGGPVVGEDASAAGGGGGGGNSVIVPGSYNLVMQYPRKVIAAESGGTLEAAGITSDTALFIEIKTS